MPTLNQDSNLRNKTSTHMDTCEVSLLNLFNCIISLILGYADTESGKTCERRSYPRTGLYSTGISKENIYFLAPAQIKLNATNCHTNRRSLGAICEKPESE